MWIQSPNIGAFSVVLADNLETGLPDPATAMIRARCRAHLELLQSAHPVLASRDILQGPPHLDYRWRLICPKAEWAEVLRNMALQIEYRNVKAAAHAAEESVGSRFVQALHRVHADLKRIQATPASEGE